MKSAALPKLSLMMFLQYAVWGIWLPILARYLQADIERGGLGFTPGQTGWIIGLAGAIGAMAAPFIAGQLADRYFSAERFMAALLAMGGVVQIILSQQTNYGAWLALSIIYSLCYMPTLALTNSIAMAHLSDPRRGFPLVRLWGTIGWITASWMFPLFWLLQDVRFQILPPFYGGTEHPDVIARLSGAMVASGVISILYAGYCFLLPNTPPRRDAAVKLAFGKAFALLRKRSFLAVMVAALPISIIHQIYFMQTAPFLGDALGVSDARILPVMTIGQFAEIGVMALLGLMLVRLGFRWVLVIGCAAYAVRYMIFGLHESLPNALVVSSLVLHGFCYACFFAASFIYVERIASADIRHSAQTVFGMVILGLGPVLAAPFIGAMGNLWGGEGGLDYRGFWFTMAAIAAATLVFVALFFRDEAAAERPAAGG